ncbi:hypothetical protein K461DRAFT_290442 [Myriangium duriaei CBS 260.36]|uniref:Uncharacterized protein n=1 Tax=Myriangium duriaei CBS 260.36 TaxID=1168546 RepID=A0A9P4JCP8_9PEZI|nr:hypothetical protein K461DRAFT_290442 [Myriangium duriaei CBS 260.36]
MASAELRLLMKPLRSKALNEQQRLRDSQQPPAMHVLPGSIEMRELNGLPWSGDLWVVDELWWPNERAEITGSANLVVWNELPRSTCLQKRLAKNVLRGSNKVPISRILSKLDHLQMSNVLA